MNARINHAYTVFAILSSRFSAPRHGPRRHKPCSLLTAHFSLRGPTALSALLIVATLTFANARPALAAPPGGKEFLNQLLRDHAYLFTEDERKTLDTLNRQIRADEARERDAKTEEEKRRPRERQNAAFKKLIETLEKSDKLHHVSIQGNQVSPPDGGALELPGDAGALLMRIDYGGGQDYFVNHSVDYSQIPWERSLVEVKIRKGITWAIIGLTHLPANRTHTSIRLTLEDGQMLYWPVILTTPQKARFRLRILDELGKPTPAMVRLTWKTGGAMDVQPSNAIDIAPQFDAQGAAVSRRMTNIHGRLGGEYWCVPEPLDMMISPGEYHIAIRRGIEHIPISEEFTVYPGQIVDKTYTVRRWVDMRKFGWYSGDDHVHNRILSDDDAHRLMAWIKAEDVHLANVVKMGDIYRTWFEQRGFGPEFRVIDGDYILSPGQECPRTHAQIGHTISMNITSMVRDTDRYFSYDWVAQTVHAQGGLWGYAHVNNGMFHVHRDMSMNVPAENVDFAEMFQFAYLGTDLYYDFLNTGFKLTASAGSDVPWGGTVGEVRVYAKPEGPFTADSWFEAVRRGRTFVSNGPMIEFQVDDALPGDEIHVNSNRKLKVRARAWGDPSRMLPVTLEIVQNGDFIKTAQSKQPDPQSGEEPEDEVVLEFEIDAGHGFWIAARARDAERNLAHTTPIYVIREGLRFWKFDAVDELIAKRLASLDEVEKIVQEAREAVAHGGVHTPEAGEDRAIRELAEQGDALLQRANDARRFFENLKEIAEREREIRKQP